MKKVYRLTLSIVIILLFFAGCTAEHIGQEMANHIKEQPESSTDHPTSQNTYPSGTEQTDDFSFPITFHHSHAGDGALHVSVNQAHIIKKMDELPSQEDFLEEFAYAYGGDTEDPTLYEYPDLFCADGSMQGGIYMVLLDVTVANPDGATSRYENANGQWANHYEDSYLFQASSICHLVNQAGTAENLISASYFSEKNDDWKNPDAFRLEAGEEKDFQLGFLIGYETFVENNQFKGTPILPQDLLLWEFSPGLSPNTWELHLQE